MMLDKISNMRLNFYNLCIDLMKDAAKVETKEKLLEKRNLVEFFIARISKKHLKQKGLVNYDETIKKINECYVLAWQFNFYKLIKVVINDMINFSQSLRMYCMMGFDLEVNYWDIIKKLHSGLHFICYAYGISRDNDYKWKNITSQLIKIDEEQNFMKSSLCKISAFQIGQYILDNDNLNPYFNLSVNDCERYIRWLLLKGPVAGFPLSKFHSAIMTLIAKYSAKYFQFKEKRVFHISSIENLGSILSSKETWVKKTTSLNDANEQKAFFKIINNEKILDDSPNNEYVSFSLTTSKVPKDTIFRYANGYKSAIILEFDKFNIQSLIYSNEFKIIKFGKNEQYPHFFGLGSIIGRVIYNEDEIRTIWDEITKFLKSIKNILGDHYYQVAIKKAANICKMFYKNKKWEREKEIRVISHSPINSINIKRKKDNIIFQNSVLGFFNRIYSHTSNLSKIRKIIAKNPIVKESFEVANDFIHYNSNEEKPSFSSLFKDIKDFK